MKKKLLTWGAAALAAYYVLSDPAAAAGAVRGAGSSLSDAADALTAFLGALS